jgi:hypothetical protein
MVSTGRLISIEMVAVVKGMRVLREGKRQAKAVSSFMIYFQMSSIITSTTCFVLWKLQKLIQGK